jgi:hypothetical protein
MMTTMTAMNNNANVCGNDEDNHDDGAEVTCAAGCGAVVFLGCFKDSHSTTRHGIKDTAWLCRSCAEKRFCSGVSVTTHVYRSAPKLGKMVLNENAIQFKEMEVHVNLEMTKQRFIQKVFADITSNSGLKDYQRDSQDPELYVRSKQIFRKATKVANAGMILLTSLDTALSMLDVIQDKCWLDEDNKMHLDLCVYYKKRKAKESKPAGAGKKQKLAEPAAAVETRFALIVHPPVWKKNSTADPTSFEQGPYAPGVVVYVSYGSRLTSMKEQIALAMDTATKDLYCEMSGGLYISTKGHAHTHTLHTHTQIHIHIHTHTRTHTRVR